ncbi:E2/UBC family protein [Natronoglomus mannanivorans]|uniref:Uncharacterized protein n=1 Tax=Natronoglomus mannanivorans TaxID=2979990 RepID=A0AAP3E4P3_9EURY|nr:hypothetical protein [Halobacteria archaeon AArc-xg1-1]
MNVERTVVELRELQEALASSQQVQISYDLETRGEVMIEGLEFPAGWRTADGSRRGDVLLDLPEKYPQHRPRVYVSEEMRFNGDRPSIMVPERIDGNESWAQLDLFPPEMDWDPQQDDLCTILKRLRHQLRDRSAHSAEREESQ